MPKPYHSLPIFILLNLVVSCKQPAETTEATTFCQAKTCLAANAMVVSASPLASKVGAQVISDGGNAVDAMVAVHFALAVTFPPAGNIGGGGFMVYRANSGELASLDFRETAPARASRTMYQTENGKAIPELSRKGYMAAGVPGSVEGMYVAHQKYGLKTWNELLQPAIDLARNGFVVSSKLAASLNDAQEDLKNLNPKQDIELVKNGGWKSGDKLVQQELAKTLERIQMQGSSGFYTGETARLLAQAMEANGGVITAQDLQNYKAIWRQPVVGFYKGHKIISMAPPSSGGIALMQLLGMSQWFPLQEWQFHSAKSIHVMAEMERRVFRDRSVYLGDPDFWQVPTLQLLDTGYLYRKASSISLSQATRSDEIAPMQTIPQGRESRETTHYSIVDSEGNAVSVTTTLNGSLGSRVVVPGTGMLLNNEMDDFSIKPGYPNMYGLVGGEANAIAPGKRMLSSMTPTIVEKDGQLRMVLGTPGGSTIITSVYQTILNVIDHKMNMTEAVAAGRFHHQWLPDQIAYERGTFERAVLDSLQQLGHSLEEKEGIGYVDAILILEEGNMMEGAADPRGDDTAVGF
jgi:gamma-glutamyltranspeptidase/glutathione hydrolase